MKERFSFLIFLCAMAIVFQGCKFTPSPWDGPWILNKSKSKCVAPTFSVSVSPDGEYHVAKEGSDFSFRCDGKDHSASGQSTSCTQIGSRAIELKQNTSAAVTINTRWDLSADGKTLITTVGMFQPDYFVKPVKRIFERTSGSNGFAGRWNQTSALQSLPKKVVLILNYGAFHVEFPDTGEFSDSRVNEPASPIRGLNQPLGFTRSVQILDSRKIQTNDSFAGRVTRRSTWKVSDDGKTLYEESWAEENPSQRDLLVYGRQ